MTDHKDEREALQSRLVQIIQRVALSRQQIDGLPDVYTAAIEAKRFPTAFDPARDETAFLPADLFDPGGPWITVGSRDDSPIAPAHVRARGGRFVFQVLLRHPDGRQGLDYLKQLAEKPIKINDPSTRINPDLPQFPVGTKLALVRRTMLIDDQQRLVPTRLIESIQLRVFRRIDPDRKPDEDQAFFELQLRRGDLLANPASALHALKLGDRDLITFGGENIDPFEDPRIPRRYTYSVLECESCHSEPGVQSMHSVARVFPFPSPGIVASDPRTQSDLAVATKSKRDDWKLLLGYLSNNAR